jgi:hypothetical protein
VTVDPQPPRGNGRRVAGLPVSPGPRFDGQRLRSPSTLDLVDPRLAISLVAVLVAGSLVSCGSHDKPAVCGSVDDLTTSVNALRSTTLATSAGASALTAVGTDLAAVKADATSEFSSQIAAVEAAYAALESSTAIAKARPTPASLGATAKDFSTFGSTVKTLVADVKTTC